MSFRTTTITVAALVLSWPSLSSGAPVMIDFEGLDAMHYVSRVPIPESA